MKVRIILPAVLVYSVVFISLVHGLSTARRTLGKSSDTPIILIHNPSHCNWNV